MIRINAHPERYRGVQLDQFGLIFLATPHSGTTVADWSQFIVSVASITLGVRPEIIAQLSSFNALSVESKDSFGSMKKVPPFHCFAEQKESRVKGIDRLVSSAPVK